MKLPKLGIMARARSIRRRLGLSGGAVILMYHRIADIAPDPWSLCVSPARFDEHLEALLAWGAVPLPLDTLSRMVEEGGAPKRAIAITFDDGYADNYHAALPVLERHAMPATFFVATNPILEGREFWWDALQQLLLEEGTLPDRLELPIGITTYRWSTSDRHALYRNVWEVLGGLRPEDQRETLDRLAETLGRNIVLRETHRPLSPSELADFATRGRGMITFGGHTADHPRLPMLDRIDQQVQIESGKQALEAIVNDRLKSFSYPFGAYDRNSIDAVRAAGFKIACTTAGDRVSPGADLFRLPRVGAENMSGDALIRQLLSYHDAIAAAHLGRNDLPECRSLS